MEVCIALTVFTFTEIFVRVFTFFTVYGTREQARIIGLLDVGYKQNLLEKKGAADPEEAQSDAVIIYEK